MSAWEARTGSYIEDAGIRQFVKAVAFRVGYRIHRRNPGDFDPVLIDVVERVSPYTMTTPEGIAATCQAVEYVVRHRIPGACVECGVWRGGSAMAIVLTLLRLGHSDRDLYLFDTFAGMPEPGTPDVTVEGLHAIPEWRRGRRGEANTWNYAGLDEVRDVLLSTGYPAERIHFVQGRVEETIPDSAPERIALLRLDTDWYESTRHELVHLYPRLSRGGALIIDDYGFWQGAKKATDEYIESEQVQIMLGRIDVGGRLAVKQEQ